MINLLLFLLLQQDARTPWTTSRLHGSPEPPPAARAERAFPALTFAAPVHAIPGPGDGRLWVVEQRGKILSFPHRDDVAAADLAVDLKKELRGWDQIPDCKGVTEVYGLAFHPKFAANRFCYVMYVLASKNDKKPLPNGSRISRFTVLPGEPPRIDPGSERVLVDWIAGGHNGCDLQFGPDGMLYFCTGDATSPSPPDVLKTGQDCSDLLSSILRIDVDREDPGLRYAIPKDNPFVGLPNVRPEIWSFGYRNPWRMSFDRATGHLWVGDVGWEAWELVMRVGRGDNYGWSVVEGPGSVDLKGRLGPAPIKPPAAIIPHPEGASITGGFVYRGKRLPFAGHYVAGDWETRRVWAWPQTAAGLGERVEIARTALRIVAFAEEPDGELLLVDHEAGGLHRLVRNEVPAGAAPFPRTLGATGIYADVRVQAPAPGVVSYSVRAPRWADGAVGRRVLGVPGTGSATVKEDKLVWPEDTVFAKTLSLGERKVETQVLHFDGLNWNAYSYLWNEEQTDADLVPSSGADVTIGDRTWSVPARAACLTCHNPWPGFAIGMTAPQLERSEFPKGLLPEKVPGAGVLVDPADASKELGLRARSYLSVNCGACHRFGGGGSALIDLRHEIPLKDMKLVDAPALLGTFGLPDAKAVAPGDPTRSVLLCRIAKHGQGHMPRLGSREVDAAGLRLLADWIASLGTTPAREREELPRMLQSPRGALEASLGWEGLSARDRVLVVSAATDAPDPLVRDLLERFIPPAQRKKRLGTAIVAADLLAREGNAERGRRLFESGAVQCKACHRVGEGPERMGPDLLGVGKRLTKAQILESILEPSKVIDPKFAGVLIQTTDGDVLSGILVERTPERIVLRDAEGQRELKASKVARLVPQAKSMMPDGLLQDLSAQEAVDLLAFLETLTKQER